MKTIIQRNSYLSKIQQYIDKELIKVLIGQRRCGKSYILLQIMETIKAFNPNANILYINKDLEEFQFIANWNDLYKYVKEKSFDNQKNYIFIDEIQEITEFEHCLKSLVAENKFDIYITGSNSKLLSGELSTYLTGRYVEFQIYPLTYLEFLQFHKLENTQQSLILYLRFGGMPYLTNLLLDEDVAYDYLKTTAQAIFYKDVVWRYQIRNVNFLNRLVIFLAQNTGNIVSANTIANYLKSQKIPISLPVVISYLDFLCNSMVINKVLRSDIQGKKIFEIGEKYYFNDIGIRNSLIGFRSSDLGLIVENAVYNNLKSLNYNVLVGKQDDKEIDFVCEKKGERIYIQVALRIVENQTKEREYSNLIAIKDNYPKLIITLDDYEGGTLEGIQLLSLIDFLTNWK